MSEPISARDFIQIKTDRLNYEHFLAGPITYIVTKWGKRKDQGVDKLCLVMEGAESTPFMPCQGMIKCLMSPEGWGEDLNAWVGRSITLFGEPTVKFGGKELGGVRISHISGIKQEYATKISERRGVRIDYLIAPLGDYPQADFEKNLSAWRAAVESGKVSVGDIINKVSARGALSAEQFKQLKGV